MNIQVCTVIIYLKKGAEIKLCDYNPKNSRFIPREVVRIKDGEVKVYNSIREAGRDNNINFSSLGRLLRSNRKTKNGFLWMYREDYELLENKK